MLPGKDPPIYFGPNSPAKKGENGIYLVGTQTLFFLCRDCGALVEIN